MHKMILRADGRVETVDVGDGFRTWNAAINARMGQIVPGYIVGQGEVELWCDEEGLLVDKPTQNLYATLIARQPIVGDVIVFKPGDIK
jgi:hypothetical protein